MQFTCAKAELIQAISTVARAASRMQKTILECIYFRCEGNTVTLKATDIAISIKTELSAQVEKEGEAAIPSKVLHEMVSRFPESDVTFRSVGENAVEISCMNAQVSLQQMNPAEFPSFPDLDDSVQVKIQQNLLRSMINQTIFAVAVQEEKPILTGLLFDIGKDSLAVVALDGYRMAVRKEAVISDVTRSCVIPSRTLRELARITEDTEENIKLSVSGSMALFEKGGTEVYTRLLEGEFVNYKNLLPKEYASSLTVETEMLKDSIERASILARETNNVVKLVVEENLLEIHSNSEMGKMEEKLPVLTQGNDLKIAFNAKYILDVLKAVEETEISMRFNTAVSPCIVKKEGSDGFEYLILPVQMRE